MGMWTKDQLYGGLRLADYVKIGTKEEGPAGGEHVALFDIGIISDEVPTDIGLATKTGLVIGKLDKDLKVTEVLELNTLAQAIAEKARAKTEGDLPAVVCFFITESSNESYSDAVVMQFVSRFDGKVPDFTPVKETIPY